MNMNKFTKRSRFDVRFSFFKRYDRTISFPNCNEKWEISKNRTENAVDRNLIMI